MKTKNLMVVVVLAAAVWAGQAQQVEYVTKFGSNGAATTLSFEGKTGKQFTVTAADATSDKATSYLTWRTVTGPSVNVMDATAADTTNVWVSTIPTSLAADDVILIQKADGTVVEKTVHAVAKETNHWLSVRAPLATNVPAGSAWGIKKGTGTTLRYAAADDAVHYYVESAAGFAAGELIAAQVSPEEVWMGTVATAGVTNGTYSYKVRLRTPAEEAMAVGDALYTMVTNNPHSFLSEAAADATSFHLTGTNLFTDEKWVLVETADGKTRGVGQIDAFDETNVVLKVALGFAVTNGDRIWPLTNAMAITEPSVDGASYVFVNATNGVIAGVNLVGVPASGNPWVSTVYAMATRGTYSTLTVDYTFGKALPIGTAIYEVTNAASTVSIYANKGDTRFAVPWNGTNSTLTVGSTLVVMANGTNGFAAVYTGKEVFGSSRLALEAVTGTTLSAGDRIWETTVMSTPVGNATLRQNGILFSAPAGTPAELSLDGTSVCRLLTTGWWE